MLLLGDIADVGGGFDELLLLLAGRQGIGRNAVAAGCWLDGENE